MVEMPVDLYNVVCSSTCVLRTSEQTGLKLRKIDFRS